MENAIAKLWEQGYFDALKPLAEVEESHQDKGLIYHKILA